MRDLASRLRDLGYVELFQRLDDREMTSLWKDPGMAETLARLALDREADALARFLAAEIVMTMNAARFDAADRGEIADVYRAALRGQFTLSANDWAFPSGYAARAGEHFVALGKPAVPALRQLLDDETHVGYEGSREAMAASQYHFRIKDLAALFLSKIINREFPDDKNPRTRDAAIAALKRRLP